MKHTNKWLVAGAIATAAVFTMSGCAASASDDGAGSGDKEIKVGFSVYDMQFEYFQAMEAGTKAAVEANGWTYELHDEKSDENEMVTGAIALLDSGIDVLIISPFKPDALGSIVDHAKELGVPVIVDDIGGGGTDYDAIVVSDNKDGGIQAADYIDKTVTALGIASKNVVSITCQPDAVYAAQRNIGYEAEIAKLGYTVATSLSGDSDATKAYTIMKDALSKTPDAAAVFACNDDMAVAAANAIKDAGKVPGKDVVVVGFNGDPSALTAIQDGSVNGTVAQDPTAMGALTVKLAKTLIDGDKITFDSADNREVYNPVTLVTADNVADFLK